MKTSGFGRAVASLFHTLTGWGGRPELSVETEAACAIFLPFAAMLSGLLAALAAYLLQRFAFSSVSVVAGVSVLIIFGGFARLRSASALFREESRPTGAAVTAVLLLLFECFALAGLLSYSGTGAMCDALIYLPVVASVGSLAAASAQKSAPSDSVAPLSGVKGWHMLLSALLAFVLAVPAYGIQAFVFVAAAVLAGALSALLLRSRQKEAASVAALVSEVVFLLALLVLSRPVVYY